MAKRIEQIDKVQSSDSAVPFVVGGFAEFETLQDSATFNPNSIPDWNSVLELIAALPPVVNPLYLPANPVATLLPIEVDMTDYAEYTWVRVETKVDGIWREVTDALKVPTYTGDDEDIITKWEITYDSDFQDPPKTNNIIRLVLY